jgi:hypothetical protein
MLAGAQHSHFTHPLRRVSQVDKLQIAVGLYTWNGFLGAVAAVGTQLSRSATSQFNSHSLISKRLIL